MKRFINWLFGKSKKALYAKSVLVTLFIIFGSIFLSIYLYPSGFSFKTHEISGLGSSGNSDLGSKVFNIGFMISGVLFLPHVFYLYRRLMPDLKILSTLSSALLFFASIGISMVGLFPSNASYIMHVIAAIFAIGGSFLSSLVIIPTLVVKIKNNKDWKIGPFLIIYGQLLFVCIFTIIEVGIPILIEIINGIYITGTYPPIWPICEWGILFSIIIWVCGLFISIPRED
ncbi:MAG: DUF998 domain-containing protein [Candidatus Lokiarchaeota archaeon]|nr:DUF998 domain-containing protein [Candidatus Lokiarchaeota archaeon]